jgi:hypothetical protein
MRHALLANDQLVYALPQLIYALPQDREIAHHHLELLLYLGRAGGGRGWRANVRSNLCSRYGLR